jgi:alkyl hydroperoxide reductase subunit AhpC
LPKETGCTPSVIWVNVVSNSDLRQFRWMRIGLTDAKRSVAKAYDVINATRKATRGTVIESSKSVMANARRMDQSPSD